MAGTLHQNATLYLTHVSPLRPLAADPTLIESLAWMTTPPAPPLAITAPLSPSLALVVPATTLTPLHLGWFVQPPAPPVVLSRATYTLAWVSGVSSVAPGDLFRRTSTYRTGSRPWTDDVG